jgi:hypothetical protein
MILLETKKLVEVFKTYGIKYGIKYHEAIDAIETKPTVPCEVPLRFPNLKRLYDFETFQACRYQDWVKALPVKDYRNVFAMKYHGRNYEMNELNNQAIASGYNTELVQSNEQYSYLTIWTDKENVE